MCKNDPFLTRKQMGFEDLLYQQYSDRRHSDCGGHRSINTSKAIHLTQANEIIIIVSVGGARPDLHKLHMLHTTQTAPNTRRALVSDHYGAVLFTCLALFASKLNKCASYI